MARRERRSELDYGALGGPSVGGSAGPDSVRPGEEVGAIAARMTEHDISHLPVVNDEEQVVGILSTTDLTAHLVPDDGA